MVEPLVTALKVLSRRKITSSSFSSESSPRLQKSISVIDITCLGLSTIVGTGVYKILAYSAKENAGPSVVLSFLIAAVASCLSGLCYSELSSRFPEGGPAYTYVYATLGELPAFLIGWSMILEYAIASALAAKSLIDYWNIISNQTVVPQLRIDTGLFTSIPGFEHGYVDLPSVLFIIAMALLVSSDLKLSCIINNVFVFCCFLVIGGIVVVGMFDMDAENWTAGPGFFPNGVGGIFSAASTCFFAFHGYDIIASAAGESHNRIRIVPVGISLAFLLGLVACFTSSVAVTLLVPSSLLEKCAPLLQAFAVRNLHGMQYLVIMGATTGLSASLIATLFGCSRLLLFMSNDGLLPSPLGSYSTETGTTLNATLVSCILSSVIAALFESDTLLLWLGLGSLLSYLSVSVSILCLRYDVCERLPLESSEYLSPDPSFSDFRALEVLTTTTTTATPNGIIANGTSGTPAMAGIMTRMPTEHQRITRSMSDCYLNRRLLKENSSPSTMSSNNRCDCCNAYRNLRNCSRNPLEMNGFSMNGQKSYGAVNQPRLVEVEYINESYVTSLSNLNPSLHHNQVPTKETAKRVAGYLITMMSVMLLMGIFTIHVPKLLPHGNEWWMELIAGAMFSLITICVVLIVKKPKHGATTRNSIPCVPLLPICAIWMDIHLIVCLPYSSWLTALVWALLGIFVYMSYGVWHSREGLQMSDTDDNHEFDLNACEDEDDLIPCLEDITDGSSL